MKTKSPPPVKRSAFTLIELVTATTIFMIILLMLSYALDASLGQLNSKSDSTNEHSDFRSVFDTIRRDFQNVIVDRSVSHSFSPISPTQADELLNHRRFMPIEINRSEGQEMKQSFVNGESKYSSLLFAAVASTASYAHPLREQMRLSSGSGMLQNFHQTPDAMSETCLIGYYVAFTPDSSASSTNRRSMKLYRHFRSGGINYGDGHSNGILAYTSDVYNPSSPRTAFSGPQFENEKFPFIMRYRYETPDQFSTEVPTQPWPRYADVSSLPAPPPSTSPPAHTTESWQNDKHPIHDYTFGDEIIARNVVDFHCEPYKKIETSPGVIELFDTSRLNQYLKIDNQGWPIFVKPDFIDLRLSLVGVEAAIQIEEKEDWCLPLESDQSPLARAKRQHLKTFTLRLALH